MLIDVATNLEWLLDRIVFVGGATTELMLTDKVKQGIRPTKDVDAIGEVASKIAYAERDELIIRVISPPYFLATKIEAFLGRGQGDFLVSHDVEDIIMVLNGRAELTEEIRAASAELKAYLAEHFTRFVNEPDFSDAIQWSLSGDTASQARQPLIISSGLYQGDWLHGWTSPSHPIQGEVR